MIHDVIFWLHNQGHRSECWSCWPSKDPSKNIVQRSTHHKTQRPKVSLSASIWSRRMIGYKTLDQNTLAESEMHRQPLECLTRGHQLLFRLDQAGVISGQHLTRFGQSGCLFSISGWTGKGAAHAPSMWSSHVWEYCVQEETTSRSRVKFGEWSTSVCRSPLKSQLVEKHPSSMRLARMRLPDNWCSAGPNQLGNALTSLIRDQLDDRTNYALSC